MRFILTERPITFDVEPESVIKKFDAGFQFHGNLSNFDNKTIYGDLLESNILNALTAAFHGVTIKNIEFINHITDPFSGAVSTQSNWDFDISLKWVNFNFTDDIKEALKPYIDEFTQNGFIVIKKEGIQDLPKKSFFKVLETAFVETALAPAVISDYNKHQTAKNQIHQADLQMYMSIIALERTE